MMQDVLKPRVCPMRAFLRPRLCLIMLMLATQAYSQSASPEFPDPGKPGMSREEQRGLGLQTAAEVYKQMPVLPDSSPETQYIQQLGQQLVSTIPSEYSWPFEFHVVAQKEINAFALPGGPMFINIGTITASAKEAELAGVMAHEMAHVYMQHSAKQAGKAEKTSIFAGIASAVLGEAGGGGLIGQLGQMGIQMGAQGLMMKYSRGDESQADFVGAVILYKAGYNPQAMADFFKILGAAGGKAPPQFFSSHPNPGNREKAIQKTVSNWPAKKFAADSAAFEEVRQHANGVKAYTGQEIAEGAKSGQWAAVNQQNGATFNPVGAKATNASAVAPTAPANVAAPPPQTVLPSSRMRTAKLGSVKIQYPENWTTTLPAAQGQFVTIAPEAGITSNAVGYGVLVNGLAPSQGQRLHIDEITGQLVQQMQQHHGLEPQGGVKPLPVGAVEGRSVMMQTSSPFLDANGQPQSERDWLVTIPRRDGTVLFMIFVAPESEFEHFQPTFEEMLRTAQF
jgi:beta-barrel assembly-enhancing protease